jgi:hypothetical protein
MGRMGNPRGRSLKQARALGALQAEYGKPIVVAIRASTSAEAFDQSLDFQEACWESGIATYPSVARAGRGLGRLLQWQRMQEG